MERLSSHLFLSIFKWLDSVQVVKIRPVCQKWLEIIEEYRSLWRRPILPRRKKGWPISTLELFDSKSQSTLEEVQFSLPKLESEEYSLLVQLLERSKHSLRFLSIQLYDRVDFWYRESPIPDLSWKLSHLVEFKVSHSQQKRESRVLLRWNEFEGSNRLGSNQNLSNLKVLWIYNFPAFINSHLDLLSNISSLCLSRSVTSSEWRRILEVPSKTLKHLRMTASASSDPDSDQLSTLHFPRLKLLQTWSSEFFILPTWLDVPTTSILISELGFPLYLPSISILCIPDLRDIQRSKIRCPLLVELEVGKSSDGIIAETYPDLVNELILVLKERNHQSEDGFEVDGVQMTPLKRLVIPFVQFRARKLEELRDLVEELLDLESVSPFIEIEV